MIKVEECLCIRSYTTNGGSTRWRIWSEDKKQYFPYHKGLWVLNVIFIIQKRG